MKLIGLDTRPRDFVSHLAWLRLGVNQNELEEVAGDRDVFSALHIATATPCGLSG